MPSNDDKNDLNVFTKDNLDKYLKELGKEYRRLVGKNMPAEIVLVGGAAVLTNYDFRTLTRDVDALIYAATAMEDAIGKVANKNNLPAGWLNADFKKTTSYTPKLLQYSQYYRQFSNVLNVRTVSAEYLIAMKLCSERQYKNDRSDITGIMREHERSGKPIELEQIKKAVINLYGSWDYIPETSREFIEDLCEQKNYDALYAEVSAREKRAQDLLTEFGEEYPGVIKQSNINDILTQLEEKANENHNDKEVNLYEDNEVLSKFFHNEDIPPREEEYPDETFMRVVSDEYEPQEEYRDFESLENEKNDLSDSTDYNLDDDLDDR